MAAISILPIPKPLFDRHTATRPILADVPSSPNRTRAVPTDCPPASAMKCRALRSCSSRSRSTGTFCSTTKTSSLIRKHSSMSCAVLAALIVIIPAPKLRDHPSSTKLFTARTCQRRSDNGGTPSRISPTALTSRQASAFGHCGNSIYGPHTRFGRSGGLRIAAGKALCWPCIWPPVGSFPIPA
jgi:hypothetical protein